MLTNSNDGDLKKQEEAEKRATKKIEKETERAKKMLGARRYSGFEKAVERDGRSPSKTIKKEKDKKETRECYRCGKVGHISVNC